MRTLADMTEEERAECVGMWCDYTRDGEEKDLVIVVAGTNDAGRIPCVNPGAPIPSAWAPEPWTLTPRYDLPLAWRADGTPPAGEWEDDYTDRYGSTLTTGEAVPNIDPYQKIRRWVGDWETVEEEEEA